MRRSVERFWVGSAAQQAHQVLLHQRHAQRAHGEEGARRGRGRQRDARGI